MSCGCNPPLPGVGACGGMSSFPQWGNCTPLQFFAPENYGLLFPSLVGPMGPPGGPGLYVDSYASLRALDPSTFPIGYVANVAGYASVADGGGGFFTYDPSGELADNNGTILSPNNQIGRWYRMFSGPVNVRWFGAKGDGATDDQAAINGAVQFVETLAGGGSVYLPAATYLISLAIIVTGLIPIKIFGDGWGTQLKTTDVINAFECGVGTGDRVCNMVLADFTVNGNGLAEIGIQLNKIHQVVLQGIKITATTVAAIDSNQAYDNQITNCTISSNSGRGIICDEDNENTRITNCRFEFGGGIAVHFRNGSCSGSKVINCQFLGNAVGVQLDAGAGEECESFAVLGCYFKDQVGANALFGTDVSSIYIHGILFQNNEIKVGSVSAGVNNVTFGRCKRPLVLSNTFNDCDVITSVNCSDFIELNNTYVNSAEPTIFRMSNAFGPVALAMPTAAGSTGELWNDSGTVKVSP